MTLVRGKVAILSRLGGQGQQGIWAIAEYLAYPAMMFIATPLYLRFLGQTQYGQWLLLLTLNGFGGLGGFGMGTVVVRDVSERRGCGDIEGAIAAVRNGLALTLVSTSVLCLAIVVIGIAAAPTLLAKMGSPGTIIILFLGGAGLIALEQIDVVFASTIRGLERFDWSARLEAGSKFVTITSAVIAAWISQRLGPVIAATLVVTAVRAAIKAAMAAHLLGTGPLLPAWEPRRIRPMLSFGLWTWIQMIGATLLGTVDRFLVGGLLGSTALAHYSVALQLAQQVHAVPAAAAQILLPRISRAARGESIARITARAFTFIGLLTAALAIPIIALAYPILRLWVGASIADQAAPVLQVAVIAYILLALSSVAYFVLLGLGRAKIVAQLSLAGGIASLGMTYFLIRTWGLSGAALSRVTYAVLTSLLVIELVRQLRRSAADAKLHGADIVVRSGE